MSTDRQRLYQKYVNRCRVSSKFYGSYAVGNQGIYLFPVEKSTKRFIMNVTGYVCCALGFVCMISMHQTNAIGLQDKIDRRLFKSISTETAAKPKRPFCNAFTGCGKKRSFYADNSLENEEEITNRIQIPVPIYRALLRAASREIQETLDRESSANNAVPDVDIEYPAYLTRKIPSREQYQS